MDKITPFIGHLITLGASLLSVIYLIGRYSERYKAIEKTVNGLSGVLSGEFARLRDEFRKELEAVEARRLESVKRIHEEREKLESAIMGKDGIRFVTITECNNRTQIVNQKIQDMTQSFCTYLNEIKHMIEKDRDNLERTLDRAQNERKETAAEIKGISEKLVSLSTLIRERKI